MVKYTNNTTIMAVFTSSAMMVLCSSCRTDRQCAQEQEEEEEEGEDQEAECTRAPLLS